MMILKRMRGGWVITLATAGALCLCAMLYFWALGQRTGGPRGPDGARITGFISGGGGPTVYTTEDGHTFTRDQGTLVPYHRRYGSD